MNKAENHADVWVEGILGRGKNHCTDSEVGICLAGLRTSEQPAVSLEW